MYIKHRDVLCVSAREHNPNVMDLTPAPSPVPSEEETPEEPYLAQRDRSTALFILKAREIHKISQSSLDSFLGDISTYIDMTKSRLIQNLDTALRQKGIVMGSEELQALSNSPEVTDPFKGLHSEYLQTQYFIKHFRMVVSFK